MYFVPEAFISTSVSQEAVTEAVARIYVAMTDGSATNFPVVREPLGYANAIFGFKSGFDLETGGLGVKAGGLWPGNHSKGLANHQSTILLFDPETGAPLALVEAAHLTALRTASASALSVRHLARKDARTLSLVGAGGQAIHQIRALFNERKFDQILISSRSEENARRLAAQLSREGIEAQATTIETAARSADVLVTITPAFSPFIEDGWVREGTHIACMGADTRGKQEIDMRLLSRARVFVDDIAQAITIGECQHARAARLVTEACLCPIGDVISGKAAGRTQDSAITIFDSTGVGLQDIAAAQLAFRTALNAGAATRLSR